MTVEQRRYSLPRREATAVGLRRVLFEAPGLPAQAVALLALLYLASTDGGYFPRDWYPVGLLVLGLVAVWSVAVPPRRPASRAVLVALPLLALFAIWALVSISWAGEPAAAWDGANRALLYAAIFALFALWRLSAREARWLVTLLGLGIAVIGLVELLRWAAAADPGAYMLAGRFSEPVGYQNGNVAFWLMGAFACLWLATARDGHPVVRGLALGAIPMLCSLALIGQSRGSLFALPVALTLFLALAPGRLRLLTALVACGIAVLVAVGPALDVVDAPSRSVLPGLVDDAARAILLPSAVLAALGALVALGERRWTPSAGATRRISTVATGTVALVALACVAVALTQAGNIRSELSERWEQFKSNEAAASGSARLGSGGTNRYDFWTVAWDQFEREPLHGVGMDNFQQDYLVDGKSREKPRFPHSFELGLLSGTGIVGALLLLGAIAAALVAALRTRRRLPGAGAGVVAGALGVFAYWLMHTSVDWFYELPGLGGLAFAMLGLATAVRQGGRRRRNGPGAIRRSAPIARVAGPVLAGLAAFSFALPWLAERQVGRAVDTWRADPDRAYERLDQAAALNPISPRPALIEGAIAVERDQARRAERAYREVIDREPRNAYAWLQLAALASAREDRGEARRRIGRAAALAPRDEATRKARAVIGEGSKITPKQVTRVVLKSVRGGTD